ncbi:MAG: tRNA lysidine(34) synthetase TilS [Eubacterium sp.]|nr:tRNA lysidine(34) synthetase TilS [Eubacterium sp.]
MRSRIIKTINKYGLLSEGDTVLIALSGGADSVLLAHFLIGIREEYDLTLKAAHIEHGIRGAESAADCEFVENLCKENGIECHTLHINAPAEAKAAGMGVEEYSRSRRYEFFDTIACDKIATAHNLSDNIETLLFRLARGTSIKGLCGIPARRGKIIRPLLELSGDEIREYLDENNIPYRIDSTNADNAYSRNRIRNEIVPLFKELNFDLEASMIRLIESANEDSDYIEQQARIAFDEVFVSNALDLQKLKELHVSIIKRILIKYFALNGIALNEYKLKEIIKLLEAPSKTQLSGDVFAVSNKQTLRVAHMGGSEDNVFLFQSEIYSKKDFINKYELLNKRFDFYCDCDKIVGSVRVRSRREGDRISPANRNCAKSLKKLYNELGIPVESRSIIPVIEDDNGVIGVYGYCVDERVKADESTKNYLVVKVSTEDKL